KDTTLACATKMPTQAASVSTGLATGLATGHCVALITPDGERTMHTHLGASTHLSEADIPATMNTASILLGEAYLWDTPSARDAFIEAAKQVHKHKGQVALSLGDTGVCDRHRAALLAALATHIDIVLANTSEAGVLCGTNNPAASLAALGTHSVYAALTEGANGAWVCAGAGVSNTQQINHIPTAAVQNVMDSTGAGDQFAAGFLTALVQGQSLQDAAMLGNKNAAAIIQKLGARP
ncbi:MAG: adenosine kinase, partial [Alphaproteobacteria bacterium]|nr:adenosine kinase [Alphaproteobacteria bacterium]